MGSIFNEEAMKEIQRKSAGIDLLLEIIGGSKDGPIDFRVLKADKDFNRAVKGLMSKRSFIQMPDEPKLALISFFEQGMKLVKEINSNFKTKENWNVRKSISKKRNIQSVFNER